jgi:hypothetical protein
MMIKNSMYKLSLVLLLAGCSSLAKRGLEMSTPLLYQSSLSVQKDHDYKTIEAALPGNVKMVEGLLEISPENNDLLVTVIKSYAAQAYAFDETKFLDEKFRDVDEGQARKNAMINYSKAIRYGQQFFKLHGIELEHLQKKINEEHEVERILSWKFQETIRDLEGVMFFAQSLGGMINLNRDRIDYLSYLPLVKKMFDWVCEKKPEINFGACHIFNGQYFAGRPAMLGGDPVLGEKYLVEGMEKYPTNWLIEETYLEHFLIPMELKDKAEATWNKLLEKEKELEAKMIWSPAEVTAEQSQVNFYQSLAIERFKVLKKHKKKIFSGM